MGRRARYYYGNTCGADWEQSLRDALKNAKWELEHNLKPAMENLRQWWKDWSVETTGQAASAPHSESYAEERMVILQMVEAGKLSPQEAARLLDAL
ncbi:MAG: hypothetical protein U0822_00505 [Anaerolineae bacterium]